MAIDPKIEEAIVSAVEEAGQSTSVARKLIAWMSAITSGNEDVNDPQTAQRLELLYAEVTVMDGLEVVL